MNTHTHAGIVVLETLVRAAVGDKIRFCAVLNCDPDRIYEDLSTPILALFGFVLLVKVLFLLAERSLLLRVITYYQRTGAITTATLSTGRGSSLVLSGDKLVGGGCAVKASIGFKNEVREILGCRGSCLTHLLLVAAFIQVTYWVADFRTYFFIWFD
jgi:hypothetical protein